MPYFEFLGGKQAKERIDSKMLTRGTKMVIQVSRGDKGFATANPAKDKQDIQSNEKSTIRMKLRYNVYGKDAGHINTKDHPQNRGNSVNDSWLVAL